MYKDDAKQKLIEKYGALNYQTHSPKHGEGLVLTHPGYEKQACESLHALPVALALAEDGHLVILTPPDLDKSGNAVKSPDGFLNEEEHKIEIKHASTGTRNNIDYQISKAGNKGPYHRIIWIADVADIEIIAQILAGKYNVSPHMDFVTLYFRDALIYVNRQLYTDEGAKGILKLLKQKSGPFRNPL